MFFSNLIKDSFSNVHILDTKCALLFTEEFNLNSTYAMYIYVHLRAPNGSETGNTHVDL